MKTNKNSQNPPASKAAQGRTGKVTRRSNRILLTRVADRLPKRQGFIQVKDQDHMTDMLKLCLQKVCELQAQLEQEEAYVRDVELEGYTACAMEAFRFLSEQGLPPDHPTVKALTDRLQQKLNGD